MPKRKKQREPILDVIDGKAGVYGIGVNDADYPVRVDSKMCPYYVLWTSMFSRCYSDYYHSKKPQYKGCSVDPVWFSFMAFRSWVIKQGPSLYDVDGNRLELDKDLMDPSNKVYSPDRCCLVSKKVNSFLAVFRGNGNSIFPGVCYYKDRNKFKSTCLSPFKRGATLLGRFDSEIDAYEAWLKCKQEYANLLADSKYVTSKKVRKHLKAHFHLDRFTSMATKTKKTSTKKNKKPILDVIDGNNWLNRAYYASAKLTTSKGVHTGALKSFVMMVNALIRRRMDTRGECYLVVAFDNKTRDTFRSKLMAKFLDDNMDNIDLLPEKFVKGYKGTRMVDDVKVSELGPQFDLARKALEARGIKTYRVDGFEADDVIGTLAIQCGCLVMVHSRDKDFAQLLSSRVRVTQPAQGKTPEILITHKNCKSIYGIEPNQVVDYLALSGDGVDNIPGIPGVGVKTALTLIDDHGDLKSIVNAEIKGKLGEKLKNKFYRKLLKLCHKLAKICTDVPGVDVDYKAYELTPVDTHTKKMAKFSKSVEFNKLFTH